MKKAKLIIATAILSAVMSTAVFAGEWKQDTNGWWYQNDDGTYMKSNWLQDANGKWYFFNSNGYMMSGWIQISNTQKFYYLNYDGSMQTDPMTVDGYTYTFDSAGACTNYNRTDMSQEDYKKNMDAISRGETAKAALYNWRESQIIDTTPGVDLGNENIVSVTDLSK
ncbi:hypothetical protein [Lacrimispora sp.]|uniref:hypothetical protein n=1 Tax=Lacrimispora sp. TaxID=2719234 RepID=UPI0028AED297|nr:hypothetical protein [Lacrimispora sp.]